MLETQGEHAEERREFLELFGLVLLNDGEVLRFSVGFVDGIRNVAQGDGRELDEVPEDGEEMLAVGELTDSVFERGKVVMCRLRLVTPVCGHRRWYPLWCSCRDITCVKERMSLHRL